MEEEKRKSLVSRGDTVQMLQQDFWENDAFMLKGLVIGLTDNNDKATVYFSGGVGVKTIELGALKRI